MDQKKFLRMRSLGAGYREQDLEKVFAGESAFTPDSKLQRKEEITVKLEPKVDMLLDIQAIIVKGKGAGYRKSGYSKKFFEEHREAITLCKAAKEAFS